MFQRVSESGVPRVTGYFRWGFDSIHAAVYNSDPYTFTTSAWKSLGRIRNELILPCRQRDEVRGSVVVTMASFRRSRRAIVTRSRKKDALSSPQ
jgi:hypothetical protein